MTGKSKMTTATLKTQLKQLIVRELNIQHLSAEEIADDEPIFSDRTGLDSIDAVEVVYLVEKHYGVAMKDMKEARPALQSIVTLADFIEARRA
jgi:acyl carrier protein